MTTKLTSALILTALTLLADPTPAIFGAAGPDAAAIRSTVTAFQNALGPSTPPGLAATPTAAAKSTGIPSPPPKPLPTTSHPISLTRTPSAA